MFFGETMDDTTLILEAYQLADQIKQTKEYIAFKEADRLLKEDATFSIVEADFQRAQALYSENLPRKEFVRDFGAIRDKYIAAKKAMQTHPAYVARQRTEQAFDVILKTLRDGLNELLQSCYVEQKSTCQRS